MADILEVIDLALAECAEPTQGDQVIAWAEQHLDVQLMPWQEDIIRRSFGRLKERGQAWEWSTANYFFGPIFQPTEEN
jgi:hypothetical protein